jgi:hypothetical protein
MLNIQSTLRTAPDLYKNVLLAELLGSNDNSCTVSVQSDTCIYTHILPNIESVMGPKKKKDSSECCVPKEIFLLAIGSPALQYTIIYITFLYFHL